MIKSEFNRKRSSPTLVNDGTITGFNVADQPPTVIDGELVD